MDDNPVEQDNPIELKDFDILKIISSLQESNPSESLTILQAFLHLNNPIHPPEYSDEFIDEQLELFKQSSSSTIPYLFELLQQIVPTSNLILSFNSIRESTVKSMINQFVKDNQKQKWGGNGEKIFSLAHLLKQSLNLYENNENVIQESMNIWNSTVLQLFEPLIDELNEYLKSKLEKQHQYLSLTHLIKPLGQLCEQLNRIDENQNCMGIQEHYSNIVLAVLQQRIDLLINKKIFDHFESFEKLEEYKCPKRHSSFYVYPEMNKLLIFLTDARLTSNSSDLIKNCNDKFRLLLERVSQIYHNYPSSTSLEHCICLLSSLSSIEVLFYDEQLEYFLYNFCQFFLNYWQIHLLHDCDADDRLHTKSYLENMRYSVYIDTLFTQLHRLETALKRYSSHLLSLIIPYLLIELMSFIYHRYGSMKISYARQNQYRADLLAFLVHWSEFAHYFLDQKSTKKQFLLLTTNVTKSKFLEYGNGILAAMVLVTCPCDLLCEQLEKIAERSMKLTEKMNWLNVIRPDWFDVNYQVRPSVQAYLMIKNIIQTQENRFIDEQLVRLVLENAEFGAYRSVIVQLILQHEQWEFIYLLVKYEHDWSFLHNPSSKFPEWLIIMNECWKEFFAKCCYICANDNEITWRIRIQEYLVDQQFDEKLNYLKYLQRCLANLPLSLHHLLCAINQHQSQYNKRMIFAQLLHKYMLDQKIDRASIYCSFLKDHDNDHHRTIERLLDRKSPLFRFPHGQLPDEQTSKRNLNSIVEIVTENVEKISSRLDVKTLEEYYNPAHAYSHLLSQHRMLTHSSENLDISSTDDNRAFTDLNLRISKRSFQPIIPKFKIDYNLVNRVELNWPMLFAHLIVRLKLNIIYHFITLRFEFQANASSSLNDTERIAVGKLTQLLRPFSNEKK